MAVDLSSVTVSATKPRGKPARALEALGLRVLPVPEDEGNVDRYVLSRRLAVERQTGSGFLRGIQDKTLFTSAIYLKEHFAIPVLIVEGQVDYTYTAFDPQAVRGALSSMMLQYGVSVLNTTDLGETVALIAMMARQEQLGIPEISLIPKRKATDLPDVQRRLVEMLPGCGMVAARDLLRHFGSVRRILNATEEELRAVRGIGARKAKDIVRVLSAEYESVDTERDLEDAIEAEPALLFPPHVKLLERQHYLYADATERHVCDLVFLDTRAREIILVELKRGRLSRRHVAQARRYLDNAHRSRLIRLYLEQGCRARAVLATVEEADLDTRDPDVAARRVDRKRVIRVLKRLRRARLADSGGKA